MIWAIRNGMVELWGDDMSSHPTFGMIQRRVDFKLLDRYSPRIIGDEIFWFDPEGEFTWIDFLWAPGQGWKQVVPRFKTEFIGFEHKGKITCLRLQKVKPDHQ